MREVRYGTAIRTGLLSSYAILSSVVALLRVRHYTQYLCSRPPDGTSTSVRSRTNLLFTHAYQRSDTKGQTAVDSRGLGPFGPTPRPWPVPYFGTRP